jgi:hypothetical protein
MVIIASAVALIVLTVAFTFLIRAKDIPSVDPISPTSHLEERRAAIYENLRDLQFEFRVGKLSDSDYQATKLGLQKELAGVMAEMDRIKGVAPRAVEPAATPEEPKVDVGTLCPHCNAQFDTPMKFCGACGKAMVA